MQRFPTVYIIDPDELNRKQVAETAAALGASHEVFAGAEPFLEHCAGLETDDLSGCVVAELRLLGINGLELQQEMGRRRIHLPLILHTAHAETRLTVKAMQGGAVTVLDKPASPQDLWDALYGAFRRNERERLVRLRRRHVQQQLARLSGKERQVLKLLLEGLPNKVIARRLDVSVRTVEARRAQLFKKTGTRSVAELVRFVLVNAPEMVSTDGDGEPDAAERLVVGAGGSRRTVIGIPAGREADSERDAGTGRNGSGHGSGNGSGGGSRPQIRGAARSASATPWQLTQIPERTGDLGGAPVGGPCRVQFVD